MYCSGCGQPVAPGQPACPQCGRPTVAPVPPVPGLAFEVENYAGKIRALSVVWAIYAAFALLTGIAGLTFAHAFMTNHFGPFGHGPFANGNSPFPEEWFGHAIFGIIWVALLTRTAMAIFVAWGLYERYQWARIVAIIVAFLSLLKFPFGTALGIWTLVVLMGYRNATLYDQLNAPPAYPAPSPTPR
jgi:hypothetical protein